MASGFAEGLPPSVRFLIAVSVLSWIPGGVLLSRFLEIPTDSRSLRVSLSFMAGLSLVSIFTLLATLFAVPFDSFVVALQWGLVLFFIAAVVFDWRRRRSPRAETASGGLGGDKIYLAVALVIALVTAVHQPKLEFKQDAYDHVGYVRRVEVENSLTPAGVLANPAEADSTAEKADPRKGTFHGLTAAAVRMAGVDPISALPTLSVFLFPLAFLNFILFCSLFLPRRWLVAPCAVLFLLFQNRIGIEYANAAAYGHSLSLVFYWALVPLCFTYLETTKRKTLIVLFVVFTGGAFIHAGVVLHFLVLMGTIFAFQRVLALPARPVLTLCFWGGLAAVLATAWKIAVSFGEANVIHLHAQGLLYLGKEQFILSPVEILRQHGLAFVGGVCMIPLLLFALGRSDHAKRILAFAAIPFVMCFTPYLTPFIFANATYMAFRSLVNVPIFATVVLVFWGLAVWARRRGIAQRVVAAAVLIVWSWVFLPPSLSAFFAAAARAKEEAGAESVTSQYRDLQRFLETLPRDDVVLSDPMTSYWISAASKLRVVTVLGQHGNPNDEYAMDRLKSARDVLSPFVLSSQAFIACDRYGVDYVVVNGRLPGDTQDFLMGWSPVLFNLTKAKLSSLRSRFRVVFDQDDLVVYRYRSRPAADEAWDPVPPDFRRVEQELSPCPLNAPGKVFEIRTAGIHPDRVLPGETVYLTIGYSKMDRSDYSLPTTIYVRFDHESITSSSSGLPGEKFIRRYSDRKAGHISRFRYNHRPFDGLYTPDLWPIGRPFYEVVAVKLPPSLRTGKYTVEFNVVTETLLPNYSVRDFLYNRDHYSGAPCLTLEVVDYLVR